METHGPAHLVKYKPKTMRWIFTLTVILFYIIGNAQSPERIISGRLTDSDGNPLPGVNILLKGTPVGTVTDADGYYSIQAPIGSTLVFAFIGMQTKEMVVTEDNFKPDLTGRKEKKEKTLAVKSPSSFTPAFVWRDSTEVEGEDVAILDSNSPTYINDYFRAASISKIKRVKRPQIFYNGKKTRGGLYRIKTNPYPKRTGFALQFATSFGFEERTKLPALQKEYSQGRSEDGALQWRGPDSGESFSWGPSIRSLSYDGSPYPYDKNGKLIPQQPGAQHALPYLDNFFKRGFQSEHNLIFLIPTPRYSSVQFEGGRKLRNGVVPGSRSEKNRFSLQLKNFKINNDLTLEGFFSYNDMIGKLLNRGSNLSTIIGSYYLTPPSFDNRNGIEENSTIDKNAYALSDHSPRSFTPGVFDNPYGLLNEMPDNENYSRLISGTSIDYKNHLISFKVDIGYDRQWNNTMSGLAPYSSGALRGRRTSRDEESSRLNFLFSPSYRFYIYPGDVDANIVYQVSKDDRRLLRQDGFGFDVNSWNAQSRPDSLHILKNTLTRTNHEIVFNLRYRVEWMNVFLSNRMYYSSTLSSEDYTNFFPSVSVKLRLDELIDSYFINQLDIYGLISRTLREAPLIYSDWSHASTKFQAEDYNKFFEGTELIFQKSILPELERKFEAGMALASREISMNFRAFNNLTDNLIVPVWKETNFSLANSATVKNYGTAVSVQYRHYFRPVQVVATLNWSKYNTKATEVFVSENYLPLAGFNSIATVIAKDEPVGAIYGTRFTRNEQNQIVVGEDGFPLVDPAMVKIGNPIPDYNLALDLTFRVKNLSAAFVFDYKKGGDIWNGTQAALDYFGRSDKTARERLKTNFVFDGVKIDDQPNETPVDFYDASKPISENRWVRYGFAGVGEEYIEDATWLRLNEASIAYVFNLSRKIKQLQLSLSCRNLFLLTPYSGVDPSSTLFNYSNGSGLDLFNAPSTRSYQAKIMLKI
jgi:hypothetical protein